MDSTNSVFSSSFTSLNSILSSSVNTAEIEEVIIPNIFSKTDFDKNDSIISKGNEICEYEVKELFEHEAVAGAMIYATLRKKDNDFISEEEFKKVPIHYVEGQSNDKALYPYAYK